MEEIKDLLKQTPFDDYFPVKLLGKGSFASVFLVDRPVENKKFALKVFYKSIRSESKKYETLFRREADVLRKTNHPNIVKYVGHFENSYAMFLVLEHCEGGDLRTAVQELKLKDNQRKLSEDEIACIVKGILKGLNHLHFTCDVMHRDIKPGNILIRKELNHPITEKSVCLGDLGLCKRISNSIGLDKCTFHCGTEIYNSPEQLLHEPYDKSADIFAVAITTYVLLKDRHPFRVDNKIDFEAMSRADWSFLESSDLSIAAKDFILKLGHKSRFYRINAGRALSHPFITRTKCESTDVTAYFIEQKQTLLRQAFMTSIFLTYLTKKPSQSFQLPSECSQIGIPSEQSLPSEVKTISAAIPVCRQYRINKTISKSPSSTSRGQPLVSKETHNMLLANKNKDFVAGIISKIKGPRYSGKTNPVSSQPSVLQISMLADEKTQKKMKVKNLIRKKSKKGAFGDRSSLLDISANPSDGVKTAISLKRASQETFSVSFEAHKADHLIRKRENPKALNRFEMAGDYSKEKKPQIISSISPLQTVEDIRKRPLVGRRLPFYAKQNSGPVRLPSIHQFVEAEGGL